MGNGELEVGWRVGGFTCSHGSPETLEILFTMSGTITLFCWVTGTPTKHIFPVKVRPDEIWGSVKDAIKEKKKVEFNDIDADTLDLWKVCHCAI